MGLIKIWFLTDSIEILNNSFKLKADTHILMNTDKQWHKKYKTEKFCTKNCSIDQWERNEKGTR